MLLRNSLLEKLSDALSFWRGVVLLGPRQVGKTTLARQLLSPDSPNYFDLENPRARTRLLDPIQALENLQGLVVIDEVQLAPDLFPVLRVLMDRTNTAGQYSLLGSAAPALLRQTNESLLGRVSTIEVTGFNIDDVAQPNIHADLHGAPVAALAYQPWQTPSQVAQDLLSRHRLAAQPDGH